MKPDASEEASADPTVDDDELTRDVLVYNDEGVFPLLLNSLIQQLQRVVCPRTHRVRTVDHNELLKGEWLDSTWALVIPGGRSGKYASALGTAGQQLIRKFLEQGGRVLGIGAGAYFCSKTTEFDKTGPYQVVIDREVGAFPGVARGPASGPGTFSYDSNIGARCVTLAWLQPVMEQPVEVAMYLNGGCIFVDPENFPKDVTVIARYLDLRSDAYQLAETETREEADEGDHAVHRPASIEEPSGGVRQPEPQPHAGHEYAHTAGHGHAHGGLQPHLHDPLHGRLHQQQQQHGGHGHGHPHHQPGTYHLAEGVPTYRDENDRAWMVTRDRQLSSTAGHTGSEPAAAVLCRVGRGLAVLTGVHVECTPVLLDESDHHLEPIIAALGPSELARREVFRAILRELDIRLIQA
eukprot:tig00020556_g11050.t1